MPVRVGADKGLMAGEMLFTELLPQRLRPVYGHNHSGNIHVHIVINSLRIEEVPFVPYMDRPADTKAGCKHRCTDAALRRFYGKFAMIPTFEPSNQQEAYDMMAVAYDYSEKMHLPVLMLSLIHI